MFVTPCNCSRRRFLGTLGAGFGAMLSLGGLLTGGCSSSKPSGALSEHGNPAASSEPTMTREEYIKWFQDFQEMRAAEDIARRSKYPLKGAARVIGVYPVKTDEPCHLVEFVVEGSETPFEIGDITQEVPGQGQSGWQVPWDERVLDTSGRKVVADASELDARPELLQGSVRVVFFMHYLDFGRVLITPFGELPLPAPTSRPTRLRMVRYEPPD